MIGIITAMAQEAAPFESFSETSRDEAFGVIFRIGTIDEHEAVLVTSGIGTTNAAIATTLLIERYGVERIIMSGVAGGISTHAIGDVIIARACVYHDADATAFGYAPGQIPAEPERYESAEAERLAQLTGTRTGIVASANTFVTDENRVAWIRDTFAADAIDMESCAVAHVSSHAKVPWIIIRAISDRADAEAKESFEERLATAAQNAASIATRIVPLSF